MQFGPPRLYNQNESIMEPPPPPGGVKPQLTDVHGAGAWRSDPKLGNTADYPIGKGP